MSRHTYNLFVSSTSAELGGKEHDTANPNYDVIPQYTSGSSGTQVKITYTADTERVTFEQSISGANDVPWPQRPTLRVVIM